jgi:hypothetical protein
MPGLLPEITPVDSVTRVGQAPEMAAGDPEE